jgi:hypothetical protein
MNKCNRIVVRRRRTRDVNLGPVFVEDAADQHFLSPDFVSDVNCVNGTAPQNSYFRLLGWLSRIPFDEDELVCLQKYFYSPDGGEGDRGNDGYVNLKLRGDLLAALDSEVADEIREEYPSLAT